VGGRDAQGQPIRTRDLETVLEMLSLAYLIEEQNGRYRYRVPLFRERMLARAPGRLLADELLFAGGGDGLA